MFVLAFFLILSSYLLRFLGPVTSAKSWAQIRSFSTNSIWSIVKLVDVTRKCFSSRFIRGMGNVLQTTSFSAITINLYKDHKKRIKDHYQELWNNLRLFMGKGPKAPKLISFKSKAFTLVRAVKNDASETAGRLQITVPSIKNRSFSQQNFAGIFPTFHYA